jgi:acylpyruvate hydrolase
MEQPDWQSYALRQNGPARSLAEVSFAPVILQPEKIVMLGWNYAEHAREANGPMPEFPPLFAKYWRALIGAYDPIAMPDPSISVEIDPEVELGVVIGSAIRNATLQEAEDAIAGYTVFNDMSVRDWQFRSPFPLGGKTWEHMTPVGPVLVTPDEIDHARDLRVECYVDDFKMQDARTSDHIFSPRHVVQYMSTIVTLVPGDLISMGTPSGVGLSRKPQKWVRIGETVRTRIEGIGELVNGAVSGTQWTQHRAISPASR